MEFRQLYYFVKVADEGNYTRASEKLLVSQPSLSKAIQALERSLGVTLIVRTSRSFQLTYMGEQLYEKGREVVRLYEELSAQMSDLPGRASGFLRCGIPPVLSTLLAPYLLIDFQRRYPDIRVETPEAGSKVIGRRLLSDKLDMALVMGPADASAFRVSPIVSDVLALAMPEGHRLAALESVEVDELRSERLVLLDESYQLRESFESACACRGFEPLVAASSASWDFLITAVELGQGLTVLPRPILRDLRPGLVYRPLAGEDMRWNIVAITRRDRYIPHIAGLLIEFLQENVRFP